MRRILWVLVLSAVSVGPASAADGRPVFAVGYSLATYLEQGGGMVELGLSLSAATRGDGGLEFDLGYHRDREGATLNTLTVALGPRLAGKPRRSRHSCISSSC